MLMTLKKIIYSAFAIILSSFLVLFSPAPAFWLERTGRVNSENGTFIFVLALCSFVFMFLVPRLIQKRAKNVVAKELIYFPGNRDSLKSSFKFLIFYLVITFLLSQTESFKSYYGLAGVELYNLPIVFILSSFIYYFSEEYLFRGFLLIELRKYTEKWLTNLRIN